MTILYNENENGYIGHLIFQNEPKVARFLNSKYKISNGEISNGEMFDHTAVVVTVYPSVIHTIHDWGYNVE